MYTCQIWHASDNLAAYTTRTNLWIDYAISVSFDKNLPNAFLNTYLARNRWSSSDYTYEFAIENRNQIRVKTNSFWHL